MNRYFDSFWAEDVAVQTEACGSKDEQLLNDFDGTASLGYFWVVVAALFMFYPHILSGAKKSCLHARWW